jgi:hypothetical protein
MPADREEHPQRNRRRGGAAEPQVLLLLTKQCGPPGLTPSSRLLRGIVNLTSKIDWVVEGRQIKSQRQLQSPHSRPERPEHGTHGELQR